MTSPQTKLIHEVRAVKSQKELANIVSAQRIAEKVLQYIVLKLYTGITEIEVANMIKKEFVKLGAPILSFPPIVAFGAGSADIHHVPSKTKLKKGDMVMFDFGTTVNHYCSDMTRTYFWGQPNAKQKQLYLDVLSAMELALKKVSTGEKKADTIDKIAREFLKKKYKPIRYKDGRRKGFTHGLGHGVGTVIHEWPSFNPGSVDILPVGCVMTIEPGVYLPGFGGVRIEDMIVITKNGYKNLTKVPKDLKSVILNSAK